MEDLSKKHLLSAGYRSGFERQIARDLIMNDIEAKYETVKVAYIKPTTKHIYTPDFLLPNGILIEVKGRWMLEDRKKHLLIQAQHPELDIRLVFQNANGKISKGSKTTYGQFCEKHNLKYASRSIPLSWLAE